MTFVRECGANCLFKILVYENKNVFSEIWAKRKKEQGWQYPNMAFRGCFPKFRNQGNQRN